MKLLIQKDRKTGVPISIDDMDGYLDISKATWLVRVQEERAKNIQEQLRYSMGTGAITVPTPVVSTTPTTTPSATAIPTATTTSSPQPTITPPPSADVSKIYYGKGNLNGLGDSNKFYYNGIPRGGEFIGATKDEHWIFDKLENASDWLLGLITMSIKAQAIGWANIFEGVANNVVEEVAVEELDRRITVEDIIYNKVPILDVNLFNFAEAGGEQLEQDNIIYIMREKIASWYVVIRTICIILLLFTLLYLGIKAAISSVASDRAEYKQKLISWVVSFIIVMFIHYFMVIILSLNETAISWITPEAQGSTATVYEQMRAYAYEIPATKGWTGTIIYVFLVYYLIKMLLFYFKRMLIVYILAIVSPALGIAYSIQKINGKSKSLGIWMKEFAFNVLIQFIHAAIYTILMGIILEFTANATGADIVPYAILLFALLNFLLKAEDIIKNIFKFETNSLKSVLDTVFDWKNKLAPALFIGGIGYKVGKKAVVGAYTKNLTKTLNSKYDQYKLEGNSEIALSVNAEIDRLKQQEKEHIMELNTNAINFAKNTFKGTVALVAGVPALYEKPVVGIPSMGYALSNLNPELGRGKFGRQADELENGTTGTQYVYIDDPNNMGGNGAGGNAPGGGTGGSHGSGGNGSGGSQGGSHDEENDNEGRKPIRTYNTSKKRKYTAPRAVLSWATLGRSTMAHNVLKRGFEEEALIQRVYSTRIQKLSVIGNMALQEVEKINNELDIMKNGNFPPIYYTPRKGETASQIAMNEKLREKYREMLEKNIRQIHGGVDKGKVEEEVINYNTKVTLKSVEEISKNYLKENECDVGEEFKTNLHDTLTQKIVDTVNKNENGFKRIKLNPEIEERIMKALEDKADNLQEQKQEIDKILTDDVKEEIVSKISVKDLTELISSTLEQKGSVSVNTAFANLADPIENLRLLNQEAQVTSGNEIYTTEQIIDLIMNKDLRE